MAKVSIGSLSTFNHEVQDWQIYREKLEQWFLANDIDPDEKGQMKRKAILLSSLSENSYKLVRDLALPASVSGLSYFEIVELLDGHLKPVRCGFAERYMFHAATQMENESLSEWAARVRGLAAMCDFPVTMLSETLRDRFVLGMSPGPEREKIFTMDMASLSLNEAIRTAEAIRCARLGASQGSSKQAASVPLLKVTAAPAQARGQRNKPSRSRDMSLKCSVCGLQGHEATTCKFIKYKCSLCGSVGHLKRVCPNKYNNHNFVECSNEDDDGECMLRQISTHNGEAMYEIVYIDGIKTNGELDCGSPVTIVPNNLYKKHFAHKILSPNHLNFSAYNGSSIKVIGSFEATVQYNSKCRLMQIFVAESEGMPLLGRDFFAKFNLQISMVNSCSSFQEYIQKFPKLFSNSLGCCKDMEVTLNLKEGAKPVFYKARSVPFSLRESVEKEINRLVGLGVLVPVNHSDYASPVVPVLKHDGSIRLCADFSVTLNKQLVIDKYPLPRIEELFAQLHNGQKYSKLDLSQAYSQLKISEQSQMYTCINTHKGLYKFTRLVYGLSCAAAIFQKTIENILAGIAGIQVFQDDILITAPDDLTHKKRLEEVFTRLQNAGLVLQREKCSLFQNSVSYLGFTIDKHGLHKSPEKVNAILNAKSPTNVSELKSFLGLTNYYRNFVKNASSVLNPLHQLLQKNVPWRWTTEHEDAVMRIKQMLSSDETLAHFNPDAKLILTVDASPTGLGAILSQMENDTERPISYASRSLSKAEQNYSQIQKEATAIIFGVRKFHYFLYARSVPFILRSDCRPLIAIFNSKKGVPEMTANRLQRYALYLNSYNFETEYIPSAVNAADFLSRSTDSHSPAASLFTDQINDKANYVNFVYGQNATECLSLDNLAKSTSVDPILYKICEYVNNGWPTKNTHKTIKTFRSCSHELSVEKSCLLRGHKLVIPESCRKQILDELHSGHLGAHKMKCEARSRFWWPRMSGDIDAYVAACDVCTAVRPAPPRAPLAPWPYPPQPWYRVHIDFLGPINNRTYFLIVDAYSKWVECFDVSSGYSTRVVIEKLCEVMSRFGVFKTIISDNGSSFVSDEFRKFCDKNGIKHLTSPAYSPISNGQAESSVKIVKRAIKNIISAGTNQRELNVKLNEFLFNYRNATHSTTDKSPAELVFGRKLRCRLDLLAVSTPSARDAALDAIVKHKQCSQCRSYGGKRKVIFDIKEVVMIKVYKMQKPCWTKGTIEKKLGTTLYLVRVSDSGALLRKHTNQLLKLKGEKWHDSDEIRSEEEQGAAFSAQNQRPVSIPPLVMRPAEAPVSPLSPAPRSPAAASPQSAGGRTPASSPAQRSASTPPQPAAAERAASPQSPPAAVVSPSPAAPVPGHATPSRDTTPRQIRPRKKVDYRLYK